nr:hypothetical protein [Candidatus Sigynarchaeota archaeon]
MGRNREGRVGVVVSRDGSVVFELKARFRSKKIAVIYVVLFCMLGVVVASSFSMPEAALGLYIFGASPLIVITILIMTSATYFTFDQMNQYFYIAEGFFGLRRWPHICVPVEEIERFYITGTPDENIHEEHPRRRDAAPCLKITFKAQRRPEHFIASTTTMRIEDLQYLRDVLNGHVHKRS